VNADTPHIASESCADRRLGERRSTLPRPAFTGTQALFTDFLEHGHREGVPIIPMYDTGNDAPVLIAEGAAMNGVHKILIGSSRRGALHKFVKGSFQQRLETLLPPDVSVEVISLPTHTSSPAAAVGS